MRVDELWFGHSRAAKVFRAAMLPLSRAYDLAMRTRRRLYDSGILEVESPPLPTISVGNLTVGGTGKTPFAAWFAARLGDHARPAIVLRGYGSDETDVHRRLNPGIPVIVNPDRVAAVREAKDRGAEIVVLDDAFQHRRLGRTADIVLIAVEQLLRPRHVLPAGPWREPLSVARHADVIVLTRKSASDADVLLAEGAVAAAAPRVPTAVARLELAALRNDAGEAQPLERLRGAQVLAIAAIGAPELFRQQLEQLGARVTLAAFRDHHRYSNADILRLVRQAPSDGLVVCTLKDAVKLGGRWPRPGRLWYVSQQLVVEKGAEVVESLLERALKARVTAAITAG